MWVHGALSVQYGGRGLLDAVWRKGRQESLLQFLRAGVGT